MIKISKIIIFTVIISNLLFFNFAHAVDYLPIVQCGHSLPVGFTGPLENNNYYKACTTCDFVKMVKNTIDFMIYLVTPALATFWFITAGFLMLLSGANPGLYGQAKKIFTNTVYAVIIVLCAWLITNTFIQAFGPANQSNSWFTFSCPAGLP